MLALSYSPSDRILLDPTLPPAFLDAFRAELWPRAHNEVPASNGVMSIVIRPAAEPITLSELVGGTAAVDRTGSLVVLDRALRRARVDLTDCFSDTDGQGRVVIEVNVPYPSALWLLNNLVIPIALTSAITDGCAPLHASAFVIAVDGRALGVVASAWSGVGKTNLVLQAMKHDNAHYVADDQVLVRGNGEMLSTHRRVSAYVYNSAHLPPGYRPRLAKRVSYQAAQTIAASSFGRVLQPLPKLAVAKLGSIPVALQTEARQRVHTVDIHAVLRSSVEDMSFSPVATAYRHQAVMRFEYSQFLNYCAAGTWASRHGDAWEECSSRFGSPLAQVLESYFAHVPRFAEVPATEFGDLQSLLDFLGAASEE